MESLRKMGVLKKREADWLSQPFPCFSCERNAIKGDSSAERRHTKPQQSHREAGFVYQKTDTEVESVVEMLQQKQSIAILLLSVAAATVCSHPISSGGSIEAKIENNTNIILQRVEEIVEQRINQLLDKVYTLDIVAETLLNNSRQVKLNATHGTVGDLGNRCLNGFRSFPGVEKCYQ